MELMGQETFFLSRAISTFLTALLNNYLYHTTICDGWNCFSLARCLMSHGSDDDATCSWFSRFRSVDVEQNRVFAEPVLKKAAHCSRLWHLKAKSWDTDWSFRFSSDRHLVMSTMKARSHKDLISLRSMAGLSYISIKSSRQTDNREQFYFV